MVLNYPTFAFSDRAVDGALGWFHQSINEWFMDREIRVHRTCVAHLDLLLSGSSLGHISGSRKLRASLKREKQVF